MIKNACDTSSVEAPKEEITWLMDDHASEAVEQIDRLLGRLPTDFGDGRVALLLCPICFGLGCGAVSAELIETESTVAWRDLGWQTDLEDGYLPFEPALSIAFDRDQYQSTLVQLRARYEARAAGIVGPS